MTDANDEAERLLALCFPGSRIRVAFHQGDRGAATTLVWRQGSESAVDLSQLPVIRIAEFVAPLAASGAAPAFEDIAVTVVLESKHEAAEPAAWRPRNRLQGLLFERFPVAFEQIKYAYERLLAWRMTRRLPPSKGLSPEPPRPALRSGQPTIIVAMYWLDPGGAESFALQCIAQAQAVGLQVVVLCDHPARTTPLHLPPGVDVLRSDLFCNDDLYRRLVLGLLDQRNVVAIHIHHSDRMYGLVPEVASQICRPLIIDTTHIVEYRDGGYVHLSGLLTHAIDHHHVITRALQTYYRDRFGRTDNVHLGYLRDCTEVRASFSILLDKPIITIAFVGRLAHQKRPILFIEIARRLIATQSRHGLRFRFVIIGDGSYASALTRMTEALGIADAVKFLGHRGDAARLMQEVDIVVAPSANEGLALIGYEALRAGALMLSTDVGAQHELIPPDLLLDPSPSACCRDAVRIVLRLATDREFAARQGQIFADRYRDLATAPAACQVIKNIYTRAVETG